MRHNPIQITRDATILRPDSSRVLLRRFSPGGPQRISSILTRIMAMREDCAGVLLNEICTEFSGRHQDIQGIFLERFEQVRESLVTAEKALDRLLFSG
jgi:hypothetical protein